MYHEKLAIAVMHGNNVLREVGDRVYLPFGSEYKLRIKNLHSKKAIINIFIDGTNVTEGGLVVYSNSTLDLERFIKSGNLTTGNRFKFIARSAAASSASNTALKRSRRKMSCSTSSSSSRIRSITSIATPQSSGHGVDTTQIGFRCMV
jgi:hypothetical protein